MLMIELENETWSAGLGKLLDRFKPVGIVFRALTDAGKTLDACREASPVLDAVPFMGIEEEGGGALAGLLPALPRALSLDAAHAAEMGALIARAMQALGLNFDLAPTLDIEPSAVIPSSTRSPGMQSAGDARHPQVSPLETAQRSEAFVDALRSHNVPCCGRHFPGLPPSCSGGVLTAAGPSSDGAVLTAAGPSSSGAVLTAADSAARPLKPIVLDRSLAALWREELVPYRALGNKLVAVEITHAVHRAYDYDFLRPASLSPGVIEGLLRTKLKYQGLALAHASLAAQAAGIDVPEAVVRALVAGCDLVLVPGEPRLLENIHQSIVRAIDSRRLTSARVSEALARTKAAQKHLRRPAKRLNAVHYPRLAREFEDFARRHAT